MRRRASSRKSATLLMTAIAGWPVAADGQCDRYAAATVWR
jgi:hypothetical protein